MKQLTDNPEKNTQGSNLTHSRMPRRRSESPWFWVQLVSGSLVFHGALLAIALPFTARLSAASQSDASTPIEFVELSEPSPDPGVTSQPPHESAAPAASTEPIQTQPAFNETIPPSDISFAPEPSPTVSPLPSPSPEVSPLPESSPEPSPAQPSSEPPQPEQRASEITPEPPAPGPSVTEVPPDRSSDRPQSETSPTAPTATTLPPTPQPETLPSDPGLRTTAIDIPVPDVSEAIAAAPSTVDSDNLNSANSEAAPVGVTLSLSSSSHVNPDGDTSVKTLEIARPIDHSTTFLPDPSASACQITPDVLNRVGVPIALQIATDAQGKVINVKIYQSSGSLDYDQLAACLVTQQWRFEPATALNASGTQRQAIASDELLITITINRS